MTIRAAGAVLLRGALDDQRVAVIHRPHRDDWTFPKGKAADEELLPATAVREVFEETGISLRLGLPLPTQEYESLGELKRAHYWLSRDFNGEFVSNPEADQLLWLPLEEAERRLTYDRDRALLQTAQRLPMTLPLLIVRHANAGDRATWRAAGQNDASRPLSEKGVARQPQITSLLHAFGITKILAAPAKRCLQTVEGAREFAAVEEVAWMEEGALTRVEFERALAADLRTQEPLAYCAHGDQVTWLNEYLGFEPRRFPKGAVSVVHRSKRDLTVAATEWYPPK